MFHSPRNALRGFPKLEVLRILLSGQGPLLPPLLEARVELLQELTKDASLSAACATQCSRLVLEAALLAPRQDLSDSQMAAPRTQLSHWVLAASTIERPLVF